MITGLLIGLREGVEAALIVGIVAAYLVRTGNGRHLPKVWLGTLAAVGASALLGVVLLVSVGDLPAPYEQIFEGLAMLLATAVVTWMLFWMRSQSRHIKGHLESQLAQALGEGSALGLVALVFVSVIREGIETSLFLFGQITAVSGSRAATVGVVGGAVIGLAIAAVIGYGLYRGSRRLDLRRFFTWTGIALVFIAAGLISRAVHEFVEVNVVTIGTHAAFDLSGALPDGSTAGQLLHAILGYSARPEVVTVVVYLVYLVTVLTLYLLPARTASAARSEAARV